MMKREGSVRTLEIIKECADTAGGCKISLEQAERAMETEQLERIADALEGISGHLSRLTSCIGSSGAFCIASVHDDELTGETRNIVVVDFFDKGEATKEDEFVARKREFSILPDASGDGTDALQYSGSFGVKSEPVKGYAKVAADGKSCTFLEKPTVG